MTRMYCWKTVGAILILCLGAAPALPAQAFATLFTFEQMSGSNPSGSSPGYGALVQGIDGNLYGTTAYGGTSIYCPSAPPPSSAGCGTVFKITPGGVFQTVYNFCGEPNCTDGANPWAGLIVGTDGNFYGTTQYGGTGFEGSYLGNGTVFKITPQGEVTTLYSFSIAGYLGANPTSGLVQASNGNFYGTTSAGGTLQPGGHFSDGTVFELTEGGELSTVYNFCDTCGSNVVPYDPVNGLVQAGNGNFYGTATLVFEVTPGTLSTFYLPYYTDAVGALILATNGDLYGTNAGDAGTIFKFTPSGTPTTLYTFCSLTNCADGSQPYGSLLQATDGNFYGTTYTSGTGTGCNPLSYNHGCGTVFRITPAGELTTLHNFSSPVGNYQIAGLVQATNGKFYGTTNLTIFGLDTGLGPFVRTIPTADETGAKVIILGTDLTEATVVTFSGTAATFTVVSASEITATVPTGATTGVVEVTTPSGTLKSNVPFRVAP